MSTQPILSTGMGEEAVRTQSRHLYGHFRRTDTPGNLPLLKARAVPSGGQMASLWNAKQGVFACSVLFGKSRGERQRARLEKAPNPHLGFLPRCGRCFFALAAGSWALQGWAAGLRATRSGSQQSDNFRVSSQLKVRNRFPKPTPVFYIWHLFLQRAGAGASIQSLCIRSTSSQSVQRVYSQIKLYFAELDVVDGTSFQMQSMFMWSDLQA